MNPAPAGLERIQALARSVELLVLDVDGVLTDGRLYYSGSGEELKAFDIQDGLGIKLLQAAGVRVAVVTGRRSHAVERRARELGIERVVQGAEDKLAAWTELLAAHGLAAQQSACIGDDLPDLPVIRHCGLGIAVPDAPALVRQHARYVTARRGGRGAVREVCELILDARGAMQDALAPYLGRGPQEQ